jgi:hypothetical protein
VATRDGIRICIDAGAMRPREDVDDGSRGAMAGTDFARRFGMVQDLRELGS